MGPMFAGKSLELLRQYESARMLYGEDGILVVNHKTDTRYGPDAVRTHNNRALTCTMLSAFEDIQADPAYDRCKCIFIEEAHMWSGNLCAFLRRAVDLDQKHVTACGLNGGFHRTCVGQLHAAIPLADNIIHIKALCLQCLPERRDAIFTHRKVPVVEGGSLVGGTQEYESLCRRHYLAHVVGFSGVP